MSSSPANAASNAPDASTVRWQFIDSSNNSRSNLTQVKRHVMQEYMRQKKGGTRQSESEEEQPRAKRGRPKKTRAAIRKSEKKLKSDGANDSHPRARRSTRKQLAYKEDLIVEVNRNMFASNPISSDPLLIESDEMPSFAPIRPSSAQSHDLPLPLDGFVDVHPQSSPTHDIYFNNISWSSPSTAPYQFMPSPSTMLSDARTEYFSTLPLDLDRNGHGALDPYLTFRNEGEAQNTLLRKDRAVSHIPHDISDAAIIASLNAAAVEECDPRPGHKEISSTHMSTAREMIRARGGPAAFANTRIGMMINWQNYILPGYETHGPNFFYEYDQHVSVSSDSLASLPHPTPIPHSMPSPPYSTSSAFSEVSPSPEPRTMLPPSLHSIPIDETKFQCEEFLDFLRRCEQLALYQRDNPQSSYITRHTAIQETSILNQILAAPPGARFPTPDDRKQTIARLTALVTLNAAMWDYRNTPARTAIFLDTLEKSLVDSEVGMSGSVEAMLQVLLECTNGTPDGWSHSADGFAAAGPVVEIPDFSQYFPTATSPSARPWFAGRMLKIASRLSSLSWYRVNEFLFSCLTLQVQEPSMGLWEADLRREILDQPTNYFMR
ncbi:uncharacterized protein N7500_005471 [Penicillium coprophilum]|uniref:uncharacterized protein n=1 Tax=Penicillium coprophilum TaxID=36646 RepID=UPI00238A4AFD|nr:uncharacterized protein N7500_005471 [Penicillium coprophilum]KAJ5163641.1 hypothetical protein N7500_005471 [Penicillium coprophilum]